MATTTVIGICLLVTPIIAMLVLGEIRDRLAKHKGRHQLTEFQRRSLGRYVTRYALDTLSDNPLPPRDCRTEPPH
ncbi:hypothetical protein C8E05_0764 [Rhodococcus wratislaviensis]|uniref:Uncharacterized protein n=1 Tax=Rhodococcus wratislaviensis TaxID=44752 RepID=A0AB38FNM7_RHOWR|nr:hypothetical protein [Rhodococcus wratislaviensis]REE71407.1 hypothetical protein C8E05_0764 [Rhodococcus wratislaviensis]SPZ43262.1 Uncharacterised protein [Rhodococcus wratislaviensis]